MRGMHPVLVLCNHDLAPAQVIYLYTHLPGLDMLVTRVSYIRAAHTLTHTHLDTHTRTLTDTYPPTHTHLSNTVDLIIVIVIVVARCHHHHLSACSKLNVPASSIANDRHVAGESSHLAIFRGRCRRLFAALVPRCESFAPIYTRILIQPHFVH